MAIGWYLNHRRRLDALAAIILTVLAFIAPLAGFSVLNWVSAGEMASFYIALAGTAATLLGFVVASATFLAAHVKTEEFYILRASRSYKQLIEIFISATWRLASLMIVTGIAARTRSPYGQIVNATVLFIVCYAAASVLIILWATMRILSVQASAERNMIERR